jgi:hypothetical protein
MMFHPKQFPQSAVTIEIKPHLGIVDLRLKGASLEELRQAFLPKVSPSFEIVGASSELSVAIRARHEPKIDVATSFDGQKEMFRPMLASADQLYQFALSNQAAIRILLGYANIERRPFPGAEALTA